MKTLSTIVALHLAIGGAVVVWNGASRHEPAQENAASADEAVQLWEQIGALEFDPVTEEVLPTTVIGFGPDVTEANLPPRPNGIDLFDDSGSSRGFFMWERWHLLK